MHDQDTYARAPAHQGGAHEASDKGSKAAVAADTAKATAKDEAQNVASTAKQEAGAVVGEAKSQVRRIATQARDQATDKVRGQHYQWVDRLRGLADEFEQMGGDGDSPGKALVGDLGQRGRRVADYLADRGPEGLVTEVTDFARRRPMAFLAGAVAAGFLVGRLGKNVWKAKSDDSSTPSSAVSTDRAPSYVDTTPVPAEPVADPYAQPYTDPYATAPSPVAPQWTEPAGGTATGVAAVPAAPVTPAVTQPVPPPVASPYASETYDDPNRAYRGGESR